MEPPATPLPYRITTDGVRGIVEVDGHDLTPHIAALAFEAGGGGPAALTLQMKPGEAAELEGLAVVHVVTDQAHASALVRDLDPQDVRDRVACMDLDLSQDIFAATLAAVADALDERVEG